MASNIPAPPITATPACFLKTNGKWSKSDPIKTPNAPAAKAPWAWELSSNRKEKNPAVTAGSSTETNNPFSFTYLVPKKEKQVTINKTTTKLW